MLCRWNRGFAVIVAAFVLFFEVQNPKPIFEISECVCFGCICILKWIIKYLYHILHCICWLLMVFVVSVQCTPTYTVGIYIYKLNFSFFLSFSTHTHRNLFMTSNLRPLLQTLLFYSFVLWHSYKKKISYYIPTQLNSKILCYDLVYQIDIKLDSNQYSSMIFKKRNYLRNCFQQFILFIATVKF